MTIKLNPPIVPRNGHTLKVLSVRRVSDPGPGKQDIRSLDDQGALHERWIKDHIDQPYEVKVLAGSGSGECLERVEYLELLELVDSDQWDLVLTEDLGRILRRIQAHMFCEACVDHRTRLIAINDHVDTAEAGWEDRSIISAWHHERSNRDTSDRIKRSHRSRFQQGGTASLPIFGYRKKPDAKSDGDWELVPEAKDVYREWFDRLDHGATYSEVSDWLNDNGIAPGPYCRNDKWDCRMVSRVTHNSLLKGLRFRNKRKTRRSSGGTYKSEKAKPADLLTRHVPHLAFFEEAYYDRVVAKVDARNAKFRRNSNGGPDPCADRPKKRTRFPGQSIYCGVCGRMFVFGGHGQKDRLMCSGAREYKCWNAITVDGPSAARKISEAMFSEIENMAGFDPSFLAMVNEEADKFDAARESRLRELTTAIERGNREIANLVKYIRDGDDSPTVRDELRRLETCRQQLKHDKDQTEQMPTCTVVVPDADQVKQLAREAFKDLAIDSHEFAKRLRTATGKIVVYPFRSCDGGHIGLRSKFRTQIASLLPDPRLQSILKQPLERVLTIDLFEPPQRVEYRERLVTLRQEKTERVAAQELGITVTAVQRAAALSRLMKQQGLTDPYVRLMEPPSDYTKLRRHLNRRYRFEPLPGHTSGW